MLSIWLKLKGLVACLITFIKSVNHSKLRYLHMAFYYDLIGIPRIREEMRQRCMEELRCPPDEVEYLFRFCDLCKRTHWVLPTIGSFVLMKNLYVPLYSAYYLIFNHYYETTGNGSIKFACLITNCTSQAGLDLNLFEMPLFSICNPALSYMYGPLSGLHMFGINITLSYVYFLWIIVDILPLMLYYEGKVHGWRRWDEPYLFAVMPKCVRNVRHDKFRQYLRDFYQSSLNYSWNFILSRRSNDGNKFTILKCPKIDWINERRIKFYIRHDSDRYNQFANKLFSLDQEASEFIEDCTSLFRTDWWKKIATKDLNYLFINLSVTIASAIFAMLVWINHKSDTKRQELKQIDTLIQETGCFLGRLDNYGRVHRVELDKSVPQWNVYSFGEYMLILSPTVVVINSALAIFLNASLEYYNILYEQADRISLAIELTYLYKDLQLNSNRKSSTIDFSSKRVDSYNFSSLKLSHQSNFNYKTLTIEPFNQQCKHRNQIMQLASDMFAKDDSDLIHLVNTYIKIQVGNRYLMEVVESVSQALKNLLTLAFVQSYGLIAIILFTSKTIGRADELLFAFVAFSLIINNSLIVMASRMHSKSKVIVDLLEKLLALTTDFGDIRIDHLRILWLKQLDSILSGSFAIKVHGVKITYSATIKLVLWTASLLYIVLR